MSGLLGRHVLTATPSRATPLPKLHATRSMLGQRRALRDLDDHLLSDIGLTRAEAEAADRLPFWDAPGWFRRL